MSGPHWNISRESVILNRFVIEFLLRGQQGCSENEFVVMVILADRDGTLLPAARPVA